MKLPSFEGFLPIDGGVSKESIAGADQFRPIVSDKLHQLRRFVRNPIEDLMFLPGSRILLGSRILIDERRCAGEANDEDVFP